MRILIFSDAAPPQVNGVVTTLNNTVKSLTSFGHDVRVVTPNDFGGGMPCPTYPEIKLAFPSKAHIRNIIQTFGPDYIHISTEGPICVTAKLVCDALKYNYTTAYHTKLPEYMNARFKFIPTIVGYWYLRWLHKNSKKIFATTASMAAELKANKFTQSICVWGRGADLELYTLSIPSNTEKTVLYVGRISVEKNLRALLDITKYKKIIVGGGPDLVQLREEYAHRPDIVFLGKRMGQELADIYKSSDVFAFPSKTDTFGIVMIEAAACGTPVAAYPVTGPIDFVIDGVNGALHEDLQQAIDSAINVDRVACCNYSKQFTWDACTKKFLDNLVKIS